MVMTWSTPGCLLDDLLHLIHHLLRPLERCAVGQLHGGQQIALVLDRDEAGRHARQAVAADADQDQRDDDGNAAVPTRPPISRA